MEKKQYVSPRVMAAEVEAISLMTVSGGPGGDIKPPDVGDDTGDDEDDDNTETPAKDALTQYMPWSD